MKRIITLIIALFALSACAGNIAFEIDDDYTYVTLTFDEEQVADVLARIVTGGAQPLLAADPVIDLRDGEISVSGTHEARNGRSYPASLTFTLFEEDGHLSAAITEFDFNDAPISDQRIDRLNNQLADGFARGAENNDSEITDVTITSESLSISSRTPRQQ